MKNSVEKSHKQLNYLTQHEWQPPWELLSGKSPTLLPSTWTSLKLLWPAEFEFTRTRLKVTSLTQLPPVLGVPKEITQALLK